MRERGHHYRGRDLLRRQRGSDLLRRWQHGGLLRSRLTDIECRLLCRESIS